MLTVKKSVSSTIGSNFYRITWLFVVCDGVTVVIIVNVVVAAVIVVDKKKAYYIKYDEIVYNNNASWPYNNHLNLRRILIPFLNNKIDEYSTIYIE